LNSLFEQPTKEDFTRALETLPESVDALYQQSLWRIDLLSAATRDIAYLALSWVMLGWRPLKMAELQHAIALSQAQVRGADVSQNDGLCCGDVIISSCAGLLRVNSTQEVGFIR
jgi:hypothetical protein